MSGDARGGVDRPVTPVNPGHYRRGGIEVYDLIEAYQLDYQCGNVIKYVLRAQYKGNFLQDLKKAQWYLEKRIALAEREETAQQSESV